MLTSLHRPNFRGTILQWLDSNRFGEISPEKKSHDYHHITIIGISGWLEYTNGIQKGDMNIIGI